MLRRVADCVEMEILQWHPLSNFGTGNARYFKFYMQIYYGKYSRKNDRPKLPTTRT